MSARSVLSWAAASATMMLDCSSSASWLVEKLPLDHAPTVNVIIESLQGQSVASRWRALHLLQQAASTARQLVPILREVLHDSSARVRLLATELMPAFGRDAQAALPELTRRAFEGDASIKHAARQGIEDLTRSARFPELLNQWLGGLGPKTKVEDFIEALLRHASLREAVVEAFIEASRGHAAWHSRVGERRAQKHRRAFTPVDSAASLDGPLDHIAHSVAMAQARAAVHIDPKKLPESVARIAAEHEYAWHLGRLIDLINRYQFETAD